MKRHKQMRPEVEHLAETLGHNSDVVQEMVGGVMQIIVHWVKNGLSPNEIDEEIILAALDQHAQQHKRMCQDAYLRINDFGMQVLHLLQARAA